MPGYCSSLLLDPPPSSSVFFKSLPHTVVGQNLIDMCTTSSHLNFLSSFPYHSKSQPLTGAYGHAQCGSGRLLSPCAERLVLTLCAQCPSLPASQPPGPLSGGGFGAFTRAASSPGLLCGTSLWVTGSFSSVRWASPENLI